LSFCGKSGGLTHTKTHVDLFRLWGTLGGLALSALSELKASTLICSQSHTALWYSVGSKRHGSFGYGWPQASG
jgi:hypothetical protein